MQNQTRLLAALMVAAGLTSACGGARRAADLAYVERPVEQLYLTGVEAMETNRYQEAIQYFNEVERQHPYSEWANRAQVMSAYTSYRARDYDTAIASAERFLAFNPANESAPYANYLKAVSYFEQIMDVGRDQGTTELARAALLEVVARYPESDYARDAQLKLDMVNDQLAGKEMDIGRWYLRNDQQLAAINRFKTVITDFGTTSHVPEALYRMIEGYLTLGMRNEAREAGAVLGYNYPDTDWYADAYVLLTGEGLAPETAPTGKRRKFLGVF